MRATSPSPTSPSRPARLVAPRRAGSPTGLLSAALALALLSGAAAAQSLVRQGGGELPSGPQAGPDASCLSAADEARVRDQLAAYEALFGPLESSGYSASAPYTFYPQAGTHYEDLMISNYVDLDPTAGVLDYRCDAVTYNGHKGSDSTLNGFGEQARGVPIFAAQDGVVIGTHDGEPDMNVVWANVPANYVMVDHGNGRVGRYWHMKNGSVAVSAGESVVAGQQLGLTGSSGYSNWPHLHFQTNENGGVVEPFAGDCNTGASGWTDQLSFSDAMIVFDFGISRLDLTPYTPPFEFPRTGNIGMDDTIISVWYFLKHKPAGSTYRHEFIRPDGSVAFDTGEHPFSFTSYAFGSWFWFGYYIPDMHTIPGTWRVQVSINGVLQVDAPIVVQPTYDPAFNQAPEDVTASLVPQAPDGQDVLTCRVAGDRVKNDLDYDIVSHHYVWRANGVVVRDVTTAARSDMLPARPASDLVQCSVTPTDGTAFGATVTESVMISPTPWTDIGNGLAGGWGLPLLEGGGPATSGSACVLSMRNAPPSISCALFMGLAAGNVPFKQGVLVPFPLLLTLVLPTNAAGDMWVPFTWPGGIPSGTSVYLQAWMPDAGGPAGASASNGLRLTTP